MRGERSEAGLGRPPSSEARPAELERQAPEALGAEAGGRVRRAAVEEEQQPEPEGAREEVGGGAAAQRRVVRRRVVRLQYEI